MRISPKSQYSSTPAFSASAKTASSALVFPWISESTAIFCHIIPSCLLSFNYSTLKTKVKSILFAIIFYFTFLVKRITMKVIRNEEVFAMTQRYENIMVAVDGSKEADLAFIKGVQSALRNQAKFNHCACNRYSCSSKHFNIRCRSLRRVTSRGTRVDGRI